MNPATQEIYDEAMLDFSMGDYDAAIAKFAEILQGEPDNFETQLAVGMAWYRKGDYDRAIAEGHKAEKLKPKEQLVHTNLSLFYMKKGDKKTAEHHGLQARIASWRDNMAPPTPGQSVDSELQMAKPQPPTVEIPKEFPDMPWKKNPKIPNGN